MTARNAAAIASFTLLFGAAACTNFFEVPIETPIAPKMDVGAFQRVLIAGFISGGTDDVDANLETVRLLRSQLRSRSQLRVIEAEVLPLAEMALDKSRGQVTSAGDGTAASRRPTTRRRTSSRPPTRASTPSATSSASTRSSRTSSSGSGSARNTRTR
jgi:hypothetical protein